MRSSDGLPQVVRIMDYVQEQANNEGVDVDTYVGSRARAVTEGYGARAESEEESLMRSARETPLFTEDVALIRFALNKHDCSERTIKIVIGEFIRDARKSA